MRKTIRVDRSGRACAAGSIYIVAAMFSGNQDSSAPTAGRRLVAHAMQSHAVRVLLAEVLVEFGGDQAACWQLASEPGARPLLRGQAAPHISLSHSGHWIACAVSGEGAIGIDIEVLRHKDWSRLGELALHATESEWVLNAQGRERDERGLLCWCRKESLIKAAGRDLFDSSPAAFAFSPQGLPTTLPDGFDDSFAWGFHSEIISDQAVLSATWQ